MMKKTLLLGLCALALTACETPGGVQDDSTSGGNASGSEEFSAVEGGEMDGSGGNGDAGTETFALSDCEPDCDYPKEALDNPESLLATRMVFFEFDSDEVREEFNDVLIAHAKYLANNPDVEVRLEGHTDERGTREYNLALSERRAKSVRQFMMLYGAPSDSISVYGFGEELPLALGSNEDAYSENRRVELVYDSSLNGE
ncbi:MAG: OmpA family protein [Pseudomonadota bacterium]